MKKSIIFLIYIFACTTAIGQISKQQTSLESIIKKASIISLPFTNLYVTTNKSIYLNTYEVNSFMKKGFKFLKNHDKAEVSILGSIKINDGYFYLIVDVESISPGAFLDEFLIILNKDGKITEQFLIYNEGDDSEYHYELKSDKSITIHTISTEKKEKLIVDRYNPNGPKERFYCKVINTQFQINNGKVIKIKESTPVYDYFIFNGESLEKQR
ncbi:hypothetical protein VB776_18225 [Arcicella sp. DC2W]|uniref:DUF4292 domain-containing protein n=1 Tax=Arcicella gelida TaxID=2984195 RepID=A0ABU5S8S6_9BACT|nr:hypothetical protein [Arcicella sp. DC2W]MEA5404878.1 hypothetical protein [Arcicella sp. DC2W]